MIRATPTRAHLDPPGDAPVGARDGGHVGRSCFRFTVRWTPSHSGDQRIEVTTRTAAGQVSSPTVHAFSVSDVPTVTSEEYPEGYHFAPVGTPGTFTFAPGRPGVVEYTYRFDLDYEPGEEHTVAASADGTASITVAPPAHGEYALYVTARTADGSTSTTTEHVFALWEPGD